MFPYFAMFSASSVLILTYWNVNLLTLYRNTLPFLVLILTYWNVNVFEVANDE